MEKIFKAKRIENCQWHVFTLDQIGGSDKCGNLFVKYLEKHLEKFNIKVLLDKDTICQYTGINDSEGNRIFEGDICLYSGSEVIVEYSTSACGYLCQGGDWDNYLRVCKIHGVTLTGHNIHDRG